MHLERGPFQRHLFLWLWVLVFCCADPRLVTGQPAPVLDDPHDIPAASPRNKQRFDLPASAKVVEGEILVKFRSGVKDAARLSLHRSRGAASAKRFRHFPDLELVRLTPGQAMRSAIASYQRSPAVLYAEPNYRVKAFVDPNDKLYNQQWGLKNTGALGGLTGVDIRAPAAWDLSIGNSNVVIAVIDSGVDYNHPDLAANIFDNPGECTANGVDDDDNGYVDDCHGIDTNNHDSDPLDDAGHGTHVAGIIGAVGNNATGVVGVNWRVQILSCKFLNPQGFGSVAGAIECLSYIRALKDAGVNIVASNNSWGGVSFSQALADAIEDQHRGGILFITSAGNEFGNNDQMSVIPANIFQPNVLSVAATNSSDDVASFSNLGFRTVHLGAPGHDILSTLPNNRYGFNSGTSMAAPFVSGVAGLLKARDPSLDWRAIKNLLLTGGKQIPALQQTVSGRRLDALGSLTCSSAPIRKRLRPVADAIAGAKGSAVTVAVLNINCGAPVAGSLQVTVSNGQTFSLRDDGAGADEAAGDGIFSGSFTPNVLGNFTLQLPTSEAISVSVLENYNPVPVVPNYRSITGTSLNLGDDSVAKINSPFPVPYGKGSFSEVWVNSNGTVSFTHPFVDYFNRGLPLLSPDFFVSARWDNTPTTLLAVLWDDLTPLPNTEQNVFWQVLGASPSRELVIEWRDVRTFECRTDASQTVRFQVVFHENSPDVEYQYADTSTCNRHNNGGSAAVGLQVAPDKGKTFFFGGGVDATIAGGTALKWQPASLPLPTNPVPAITRLVPNSIAVKAAAWIQVQGSNFVPASQARLDEIQQLATRFVSDTSVEVFVPDFLNQFDRQVRITIVNPAPGGGTSNFMLLGMGQTPMWLGSLSPTSVRAGSGSFTLSLVGEGLSRVSSVLFGFRVLPARNVSATRVETTVPADALTAPGQVDVSVHAGPTANFLKFRIDSPSGSTPSSGAFLAAHTPGGTSPTLQQALRSRRFLGWSLAQRLGADYISRFSRARDVSSFEAAVSAGFPGVGLRRFEPAGFLPSAVTTADFNGDGKVDWVVANGGDDTLWMYRGTGDGRSALPTVIPTLGLTPIGLLANDLDGDGDIDLLVAEADSGSVGVFRNRGDGTFAREERYFVPSAPIMLLAGDFTGDGRRDIAVALAGDHDFGAIAILPGQSSGSFGRPITRPSPDFSAFTIANWIVAGDWDGDGDLDLAVSEITPTFDSGLWVYTNRGDGSFKREQQLSGGISVAAGDVDEDGCLDLASQGVVSIVDILHGTCDGRFESRGQFFAQGDTTYTVELADVNKDGHLDVVGSGFLLEENFTLFGQNSGALLSVAHGDGRGNFARPRVYRGASGSFSMALADLNADGALDVLTANQDTDSVTAFLNNGAGEFGPPDGNYIGFITAGGSGIINAPRGQPVPADFTGDGKKDLLVLAQRIGATDLLTVPQGTNGRFGAPLTTLLLASTTFFSPNLVVGDFRNTGKLDVLFVMVNLNSQIEAHFMANNGSGIFSPGPSLTLPGSFLVRAVAGDINRDGKLDCVLGLPSGQVRILRGNGDGTFTALAPVNIGAQEGWIEKLFVRDFTGDGNPDVLAWFYQNSPSPDRFGLHLLAGNGAGGFAPSRKILQPLNPFLMGDLNEDGRPDIVEFNFFEETGGAAIAGARILLGQSDGTFVVGDTHSGFTGNVALDSVLSDMTDSSFSSNLADYDGDGHLDLAVFQRPRAVFTPTPASVFVFANILRGVGDGTFIVGRNPIQLKSVAVPRTAADLDGDGRAEIIELDHFTSSFHVIKPGVAPALALSFNSLPVVGFSGKLRVKLNTPASAASTVTLTPSSAAVTVQSSVSIPAGQLSVDLPFTLAASFAQGEIFAITGTMGSETAVAYATKALRSDIGPRLSVTSFIPPILAGEPTDAWDINAQSVGGYQGTLDFRCNSLPQGSRCDWKRATGDVPAGGFANFSFTLQSAPGTPVGSFPFSVIAGDGTNEFRLNLQFKIGDFAPQLLSIPVSRLGGNFATAQLRVDSVNEYQAPLAVSCAGLPSGASCLTTTAFPGTEGDFLLRTDNVVSGDHPFEIVFTAGRNSQVSKRLPATLRVQDVVASAPTTNLTLRPGESTVVNLTLNAPNGFDDSLQARCFAGQGLTCSLDVTNISFQGSTTAPVRLSINVLQTSAALPVAAAGYTASLSLALFFFATVIGSVPRKRRLLMVAALGLIVLMVACGGGGGDSNFRQPPGPPPPPPPPTPVTSSVTLHLSSPSDPFLNKQVAIINVTIQR